jgi:hypothetical protein
MGVGGKQGIFKNKNQLLNIFIKYYFKIYFLFLHKHACNFGGMPV